MGFDVFLLPEEEVYNFYRTYKFIEGTLAQQKSYSSQDYLDLKNCRKSLLSIEKYSMVQRKLGNNFSPANLFAKKGKNPVLTLQFFPGSKSYKKFGESIFVAIRFTERDLINIIKCLINNTPKTPGFVKFKLAFGSVYYKLCSTDIYDIR